MVVHILASAVVTFLALRIAAQRGVDRYVRYGLAAVVAAAVVGWRLAGNDGSSAAYWAVGFIVAMAAHDWLTRRRQPSRG